MRLTSTIAASTPRPRRSSEHLRAARGWMGHGPRRRRAPRASEACHCNASWMSCDVLRTGSREKCSRIAGGTAARSTTASHWAGVLASPTAPAATAVHDHNVENAIRKVTCVMPPACMGHDGERCPGQHTACSTAPASLWAPRGSRSPSAQRNRAGDARCSSSGTRDQDGGTPPAVTSGESATDTGPARLVEARRSCHAGRGGSPDHGDAEDRNETDGDRNAFFRQTRRAGDAHH